MSLLRIISFFSVVALTAFALSALEITPRPAVERAQTEPVNETTLLREDGGTYEFPKAANAPEKIPPPKKTVSLVEATKPIAEQLPAQSSPSSGTGSQVTRIQNPYPFPPFPDEALNLGARASLVNVFCVLKNGQSVSGSGVFIDPRGILMTNAHIAQYVLLDEVSEGITCLGRTGAPAKAVWKLRVVFMPSAWVEKHAVDLRSPKPTGTGEHDYALLSVELLEQTPAATISHMEYDAREAVTFESDEVLLASYPAGFIGSFTVQNNLYPATTFGHVRELFTFKDSSIDLMSLGGVILAQGGSSGGTVMNRWGRLVGIIVTTSEGETTAERDLRAITLAHIDRSMREHVGLGLAQYIDADVQARASDYRANVLPGLAQKLLDEIPE